MELKRYFDYNGILNEETAGEVYALCNEKLQSDSMTARNIIKKSNVKMIGTADDPIDSLEWHIKLRDDKSFETLVVPSFRPDKAINIEKAGFAEYVKKLSAASDIEIKTVQDVKSALSKRLDFFCELGCRAADHGLDYIVYSHAGNTETKKIFNTVINGGTVSREDADKYKTLIMLYLGNEYAKRGIVMQLRYGAQKNTNSKKYISYCRCRGLINEVKQSLMNIEDSRLLFRLSFTAKNSYIIKLSRNTTALMTNS